jgi:hypothetical protein
MLKKLLYKIKNLFSKEESKKTRITEEMGIHEEWYERAREMDQENLDDFINELINGYVHDYGTICHAIAAAGVAASYAIERSKAGGITGFQAGAVKWEYLRNWDTSLQDKPLRMVDYSNLLYPQYRRDFTSIKKSTWEWVQKEAKNRLDELPESEFGASENVIKHWESIDDGEVPFGLEIID